MFTNQLPNRSLSSNQTRTSSHKALPTSVYTRTTLSQSQQSQQSSLKMATFAENHEVKLASGKAVAVSLDGYGDNVFRGAVAAPYLRRHGLPADTLDSIEWTTNGNADKVRFTILFLHTEHIHLLLISFSLFSFIIIRLLLQSLIGPEIVVPLSSATGSNLSVPLASVTAKLPKYKSK